MRQYCLALLLMLPPVLTPTTAPAEILIKGEAKMGLAFDGEDLKPVSGAELRLQASGVTDGGLEYGVVLDLDSNDFTQNTPRGHAYMSSGNHSLKLGNGTKH